MNILKYFFFIMVISAIYIDKPKKMILRDILNGLQGENSSTTSSPSELEKEYLKELNITKETISDEDSSNNNNSGLLDYPKDWYNSFIDKFMASFHISSKYISIVRYSFLLVAICILTAIAYYFRNLLSACLALSNIQTKAQALACSLRLSRRNTEEPQVNAPSQRQELSMPRDKNPKVCLNASNLQARYREPTLPPEERLREQQQALPQVEPENIRTLNVSKMNVQRSLVESDQRGRRTRRTDVHERTVQRTVQGEQSSQVQEAHTSRHTFTVRADVHSPSSHIRYNTRSKSKKQTRYKTRSQSRREDPNSTI